VGVISDFPSREVMLAMQHGERSSGRLIVTRHLVHQLPVMVASCYGFPQGPTWPDSRNLNKQLLASLTKEVIVGGAGPRIIAGDFNCDAGRMDEFRIWESYGWSEVQVHANMCWQRPIVPTCKGATVIDMIWMSPEAALLCRNVGNVNLFTDHTTLYADFAIPEQAVNIRTWPKPTSIPWDKVDLDQWHTNLAHQTPPVLADFSATEFFTEWAQHWESALDGCMLDHPQRRLDKTYRGRAIRTKPMLAPSVPPMAKASRPGEVQLRSDLVSSQVQQWFKQLRRIRSYKHAALANKDTLDAEAYRLNLWMAIRRSRGFEGHFDAWWTQRRHKTPAAPDKLPLAPPDGRTAELIFLDFKTNFEAFERWHIRQRCKLLQLKYDNSCHRLFQELRHPQRDQIDMLWHTQDFTILAVDHDHCQLHLDQPALGLDGCVWFLHDVQVEVRSAEGDLLTMSSLPQTVEPGDLLQCHQYFSTVDEVHQALLALWQPRWQQASMVGTEQWNRIIGFIQAYMPKHTFPKPQLTLDNWRFALDHFPKRPARGVDGIDVCDLKKLPPTITANLLDFLGSINGTDQHWPQQLLFGTVVSLAKQAQPHLPNHFRPVVILGTVYRTWSRMCALPLLRLFGSLVPAAAHGFLPGRECAQIWLQLQSFIEVCIQQGIEFSGFSTDIEKCFNNVGRDSLMALASHVGIDDELLLPWRSFLDEFVRSFQVRTALSPAAHSSQGLPEGCSLSVAGMVLIDWAFHIYLAVLNPSVHAFSYVDNVSEAGHLVMDVVKAFFSTICFFQLWGLTLDVGKTYFWSTTPASRDLLRLLGLTQQKEALELGGSMTFDAMRRNRQLRSRGDRLQDKWERLRRSPCPLSQKFTVLPLAFWASALYGAASCPVADNYIHQLRQAANKALRCKQAGSNALLRFSLNDRMEADPGFFHLVTIVQTFRRVCGRSPRILDCWRLWWHSYDGKLTHGPFGVLMEIFNKIGWSIGVPPMFFDRQGHAHDLLLISWPFLHHLLEEAWLCYVASTLTRPSMSALQDIDGYVSRWRNSSLTPLQRSLQSALQSGSFMDAWTQGKFDVTKSQFCSLCSTPNSHEHVLVCPKYRDIIEKFSLTDELSQLPRAFSQHLLCPRSPWLDGLRTYFMGIEDSTETFVSAPVDGGLQHLFTDGSLMKDGRLETHRAAWALYNATSGQPVADGWLAGLPQTIVRAEITALLAALRWALHWGHQVHVWLDALEVHRAFQRRLAGLCTEMTDANSDLWMEVDSLLQQGALAMVTSSWIPSHLNQRLCESPFEEWVAQNNGIVDAMAVRRNADRPMEFRQLLTCQKQWDERHTSLMDRLRHFYFEVFERNKEARSKANIHIMVESSDDESESRLYSFVDNFTAGIDPDHFVQTLGYPVAFLDSLMQWLRTHEDGGLVATPISFLELTVGLLKVSPVLFPFRNPMDGGWQLRDRHTLFERPTVSYFYSVIQKVFRYLCRHCCEGEPRCLGLNRSSLGITIPLEGIYLRLDHRTMATVHDCLCLFTSGRPVRRSCDLARPLA
jgi:ribonuclease HI